MKLIVAGTRDFNNVELVHAYLDKLANDKSIEMIISGMAKGPDTYAYIWAKACGIPVKEYPADWNRLGKKAGILRNAQMARAGTHLLAFWDGKSSGTENMITEAKKNGLKVKVVRI